MTWTTQPAVLTDTGLYINECSIVEVWERPIQEALADAVCIGFNLRILEIGYGLGLAAKRIAKNQPASHVVIEAHPEIAERAKGELSAEAVVIEEFWENAIGSFGDCSFEGIVFDSYPFDSMPYTGTSWDTFQFVSTFAERSNRLLKAGGKLGFLDFSNSIHKLEAFVELSNRLFSSLEVRSVPLEIPQNCSYASGTHGNVITLTK